MSGGSPSTSSKATIGEIDFKRNCRSWQSPECPADQSARSRSRENQNTLYGPQSDIVK